jgi:hypothetical protein
VDQFQIRRQIIFPGQHFIRVFAHAFRTAKESWYRHRRRRAVKKLKSDASETDNFPISAFPISAFQLFSFPNFSFSAFQLSPFQLSPFSKKTPATVGRNRNGR